MKKELLFFIFLFISNFIYCQTQKGTHFFGKSHISTFNSYETNFFQKTRTASKSFGLEYGLFIKDNVLVGASLLNQPELVPLGGFVVSGNVLSLRPFYRRYFGQKKIKPFAEAGVDMALFGSNLFYQVEIRPGVALFLTPNTSLDLSFNFLLLNNRKFFPNDFVPEIGLALRFFLQYDKENKSPILAKDMIKKGVLSADVTGYYRGFKTTNLYTDMGLKYFFVNNIYVRGGFNTFIEKYPGISVFRGSFNPQIGIGGYYPLGDFLSFTIQANGQKYFYENKRFSVDDRTANILEAEAKAGVALFLGRQRFEILTGIEHSQYEGYDVTQPQTDNNFVVTINHEYFLGENFSINSSLSAFPKNKKNRYSVDDLFRFDNTYNERYELQLNIRLKWYIGTKKTNSLTNTVKLKKES